MPTYPVYVPRKSYRGANPKTRSEVATRNALAARLEAYLNAQEATQDEPYLRLTYGSIALAAGIAFDQVRDILHSVDAGSGGITMFISDEAAERTRRKNTQAKQAKAVEQGKAARAAGDLESANPYPKPEPGETIKDLTLYDSWNFGYCHEAPGTGEKTQEDDEI